MSNGSFFKILGWGLFLIILGAALWILVTKVILPSLSDERDLLDQIEDLKKQREEQEDQIEDLEEDVADLEQDGQGIPWYVIWLTIGGAFIGFLFMMLFAGDMDKGKIGLQEAIDITSEWLQKHYGWEYYQNNPRAANKWIRPDHLTGQKIDGAPDSYFYFIAFVRDSPEGLYLAPGSQCICYYILNTDKEMCGVIPGINQLRMWELFKMQIQKSAKPTELREMLDNISQAAKVATDVQQLERVPA